MEDETIFKLFFGTYFENANCNQLTSEITIISKNVCSWYILKASFCIFHSVYLFSAIKCKLPGLNLKFSGQYRALKYGNQKLFWRTDIEFLPWLTTPNQSRWKVSKSGGGGV